MNLDRAIEIAKDAHSGQVDKAGAPYVGHPLRVMAAVHGEEAKIVGVLHDVVEDCPEWTFDRLKAEGFSDTVLQGLASVAKIEGEDYPDFIARAARNPLGNAVKRADLTDNLDLSRIPHPTERDRQRIDKYKRALAQLDQIEASVKS
jgi:(p)ppGpp synthase/HD superfamily hydrolase